MTLAMNHYECYECGRFIVDPFYDDEEVFWIGKQKARAWCSSACHEKSAERWWSNRQ